MSNLPKWHGASECYSRAYAWMNAIASKSRRATDDVHAMVKALNAGDEDTIKALNWTHREHWLGANK